MSSFKEFDHLRIPLQDIEQATHNFSETNLIGRGGFGKVYKGELLGPKGFVTCAFKRLLDSKYGQGSLKFWQEIMMLSRYKHENLVSLVGCCDEGAEKVLVYEFLARGSLDRYLSSAELTWSTRLQICLGAARGLHYLHNPKGTHQRLLHRDIKSANILLDENWQAKITDFGLSKIGPAIQQSSFLLSNVVGSFGYCDPSYLEMGILTKESDIYSFGVVLFEVLCGRLAFTGDYRNEGLLSRLACQSYENGSLTDIIDPILRKQMNQDSSDIFSSIAYQCLQKDRQARPTISNIVQELEKASTLQHEFEKELSGSSLVQEKYMEPVNIPLEDIKFATEDFHDDFVIGHGGFGKLYKADIFHFVVENHVRENKFPIVSMEELSSYPRRQTTVAMKRLDRRYGKGTAEFLQEISMFRHENIVKLVGFCDEDHECILVYEYASNRSLDEYIRNTGGAVILTWELRLQICLDAARGLEFLHNGVEKHHRTIHGNVKSSNILLDGNWRGMITDFGLSRTETANLQATFLMTHVAGTLEYIDPLYHKTGVLTKESDVYSFGVILFEVLSGRLANFCISKDNPEFVPHMAKRCFEQKKVYEIIDPKLKEEFEKVGTSILDIKTCLDSINIFAAIAYQCIQEKRHARPTMAEVVKELEKALKSHVKGVADLRIPLDEIKFATNGFSDPFEHGAFGMVYKGELSGSKGYRSIIVMRLDPNHMVDSCEKQLCEEIAKLYSYSHKNIIPLVGFCEEAGERILVFEHMLNGSVKEHLKNTSLTWKQRLKICIDAANGLAYIHGGIETQHLIHGHINSGNILLDHNWEAVISDFIISKGAGTLGYYDPFYARTGIRTQKSDVYSFGVVLFEILSGRSAVETLNEDDQRPLFHVPNVEGENYERGVGENGQVIFLALLAAQCFEKKRLEEIVFHDIKGQIEATTLEIFSTIAYQCLLEQPKDRPTMVEVVKELEKAFECQEKDEKLDGDAALDKIFLDIYQDADEDTRRAMRKSFVPKSLFARTRANF